MEPAFPNADILIQPILAYGDGQSAYTIFNGMYNWLNSDWEQSSSSIVLPGDNVTASISYNKRDNSYTMSISSGALPPILTNIPAYNSQVFTDVYFVVEHQPDSCTQYPADGGIVFRDISIAWEGNTTAPAWAVKQYKPACNSDGKVVDAATLEFTWDTA